MVPEVRRSRTGHNDSTRRCKLYSETTEGRTVQVPLAGSSRGGHHGGGRQGTDNARTNRDVEGDEFWETEVGSRETEGRQKIQDREMTERLSVYEGAMVVVRGNEHPLAISGLAELADVLPDDRWHELRIHIRRASGGSPAEVEIQPRIQPIEKRKNPTQ